MANGPGSEGKLEHTWSRSPAIPAPPPTIFLFDRALLLACIASLDDFHTVGGLRGGSRDGEAISFELYGIGDDFGQQHDVDMLM